MILELSVGVVTVTSLGAWVAGKALRRSTKDLAAAFAWTIDGFGTALVFLAINGFVAACAIFVVRSVTGTFLAIYGAVGIVWVFLSLVQGFVFHAWRTGAKP